MRAYQGEGEQRAVQENVERVRRAVPAAIRAERTEVVYDTAWFMYEVAGAMAGDQVLVVFLAIAWAREHP